jgi:glycosyltransferase involved in cell wall biosynthesis
MKIALLSPFIQPIVEPFVGGTEAFLACFASALRRQGVDVVCYACEGSYIPGVDIRTCGVSRGALAYPRAPHELNGDEILAIRAYEDTVMYQAIEEIRNDSLIDVLHNHSFSAFPLLLSHRIPQRVIHTLHLPPMLPNMREALRFCRQQHISLHLVAVSQSQARLWHNHYPVSRVIFNGLDVQALPASCPHEGRLAFVSRMDPDKGVEDAIEVALHLGKPLDLYGAPQLFNTSYFETRIAPLLQRHATLTYHGLVSHPLLFRRIRKAQALLCPVKWDEPFGNVVIEAMAVGTPVIMYDRGSARELIKEGVGGFVVPPDDLQAMSAAVEQTDRLDHARCATYARERFHIDACVQGYLSFLQTLSSPAGREEIAYRVTPF